MKYQKPAAREMGKVALAAGLCTSGTYPREACRSGGSNVGPCSQGYWAGQACSTGDFPNTPTNCVGGTFVTQCTNGQFAGLE